MAAELLLMRHAKSDWGAEYRHDIDRPLNKRGKKDALRVGQWLLQQKLVPDYIITSPARRARMTAEIIADIITYAPDAIRVDEALYDAGFNGALGVIVRATAEYARVLIIAHNPVMDELVRYLADRPVEHTAGGKLMTTAAVAVFKLTQPVAEGSCRLQMLMRPKELP